MFASKNIYEHIFRGIIGLGGFYIVSTQFNVLGWPILFLIPLSLFALRGCPMCWLTGLFETIAKRDSKHLCVGGSCADKE